MNNSLSTLKQTIKKCAHIIQRRFRYSFLGLRILGVNGLDNYIEIGKKRIFLLGITSHNNIGDQAITYAEEQFVQTYFNDYDLIEIYEKDVYKYLRLIRRVIQREDYIFLHGGGNIGVEYYSHEYYRQKVLRIFRNNKIVVFPQTIDFRGDIAKERISLNNYNSDNVLVACRERFSYNIAKKYISENKVFLIPDIVLFLKGMIDGKENDRKEESNKIILCFREDQEKKISDNYVEELSEKMESNGYYIEKLDMIYREKACIDISEKKEILDYYFNLIREAGCLICDRLHGMVFSYLVGTKCVVFSNYNHKIKGVSEWMKDSKIVQLCDEKDDIINVLRKFDKEEEVDLTIYFKNFAEEIREM